MLSNYAASLAKVLTYEGGYSNDPKDPGGSTYKGVTQATYAAWRKRMQLDDRSVRLMTETELQAIYQTGYWNTIGASTLPTGVDLVTFDASVNSGPRQALTWLKRSTKLTSVETIDAFCSARLSFLKALRTWSHFGKGWQARVTDVEATAIRWAGSASTSGTTAEKQAAGKQATDTAAKVNTSKAKKHAKAAAGAGTATGGTIVAPAVPSAHGLPWEVFAVLGVLSALAVAYFIYNQITHTARATALAK